LPYKKLRLCFLWHPKGHKDKLSVSHQAFRSLIIVEDSYTDKKDERLKQKYNEFVESYFYITSIK